ncbi:MAG: YARHG domain-containing protein [Clostridiales bacterium]|nr:YARHG domain-containing protein [Clostridiales bacterium]
MICKKCGAQLPDEAQKCEFCGEVFVEEPTQKIDINKPEEQSADGAEEKQRSTHEIFEENARKRKMQVDKAKDERQQQLEEITERRNAKKQRQKRNKIILIVCLCVAVVAAAGVGTYFVRNGGLNIGGDTVISTPNPSVSPIPTIAPVATPTAVPGETPAPENSQSAEQNGESTNWTATGGGNSSSGSTSSGTSTSGTSSGSASSSNGSSSNSSSGGTSSGAGTSGQASSSGTSAKNSGAVTNNITAKLAVGGQVINDAASGKSLMTFIINDTTYYANVSAGSTTEQIKGKPMTVTATPTSARYNGNTVYEITTLTYYEGDYILPNSGTKLITKAEIQNLSKEQLGLARNEIYARHGRKFQMQEYQKYFESKSWYKVNPNYDYSDDNKNLNETELKNVETILAVENAK